MPAGIYNFTCEQGSDFNRVIEINNYDGTDADLLNKTGRMQVRKDIDAPSALIELTTENGRMTFDAEEASITLVISSGDTAALQYGGVYDLEIIDESGTVERLLQGNFVLDGNVTT